MSKRPPGTKTYPRDYGLRFALRKGEPIWDGLRFYTKTGQLILTRGDNPISMSDAVSAAHVQIAHDRESGKRKVTVQMPAGLEPLSLYPDRQLLNYAAIYFVDTNTRTIDGAKVSVSACLQASVTCNDSGLPVARIVDAAAIEFHNADNPAQNPEHIGWNWAADRITTAARGQVRNDGAALVVDSFLDLIPRYNAREVPVFGKWYLPPGITLLYATDSAADSILNILVRRCNGMSGHVLDFVKAHKLRDHLMAVPPDWGLSMSHVRMWVCKRISDTIDLEVQPFKFSPKKS